MVGLTVEIKVAFSNFSGVLWTLPNELVKISKRLNFWLFRCHVQGEIGFQ